MSKSKECPNCGEPFSKDNKPCTCPECGKDGCTICVAEIERLQVVVTNFKEQHEQSFVSMRALCRERDALRAEVQQHRKLVAAIVERVQLGKTFVYVREFESAFVGEIKDICNQAGIDIDAAMAERKDDEAKVSPGVASDPPAGSP